MKSIGHLNGICVVAFFLVQLLPNVFFLPFIFHEIGPLLPAVFTVQGSSRHPVSGISFFFQHPLFFSYDFPVIALTLIWPFLSSSQPPRSRFVVQPFLACLGIIAGYLVELLTYHLRVLDGRWPADWLQGFAFHAYFSVWTLASFIVAFGLSLCASLLIQRLTKRCSKRSGLRSSGVVLFIP